MVNKYNMTIEENIFLAKRNIVDYIWKSANLEGIAVTYPETQAIFDGLAAKNMKVDDIIAINNLKHAWRLILDNIDYTNNYNIICDINKEIGNGNLIYRAGFLRTIPVRIGGTNWVPDVPIESQIIEQLEYIYNIENETERAIKLLLYIARKQMFTDGNKRTAMMAANHIMIQNGCGIITIPLELQPIFNSLLLNFYETGIIDDIAMFLYNNCIDGLNFR